MTPSLISNPIGILKVRSSGLELVLFILRITASPATVPITVSRTDWPLRVDCLCSDRFYRLHFLVGETEAEKDEETTWKPHGWQVIGADV